MPESTTQRRQQLSEFDPYKGWGIGEYNPLNDQGRREKELQAARDYIATNPQLADAGVTPEALLTTFKAKDRGILGYINIGEGYKGQKDAFLGDVQQVLDNQYYAKRHRDQQRTEAYSNAKEFADFQSGLNKKEMEVGFGFQERLLGKQQQFASQEGGLQRGHETKLTGMKIGGEKDIANIQGQYGLKQADLTGRYGIKQAELQGQYNLAGTKLQTETQRYGHDVQKYGYQLDHSAKLKELASRELEGQRQRQFLGQESARERAMKSASEAYSNAQNTTQGRRQMITSILGRGR